MITAQKMMTDKLKLAETKIAKQLSSYTLIHYDLEFAIHAFNLAAGISVNKPNTKKDEYIQHRMQAIKAIDPALKSGAAAMIADANRSEPETMKSALFEAAIVSYARCFNVGLRTSLSKKLLAKQLPESVQVHDQIMMARNKHIAHSELKHEHSIVGFRNVEDQAYGARPSTVLSTIAARRKYPSNDVILRLANHCSLVDNKIVQKIMLDKAKALREQLLKISDEEIDKMKNFEDAGASFDRFFS